MDKTVFPPNKGMNADGGTMDRLCSQIKGCPEPLVGKGADYLLPEWGEPVTQAACVISGILRKSDLFEHGSYP